jgi:Uma2 family endonuclease
MHTSLVPEPIKLNYQDFCALPDDGRRYEILDGDLYMSPSPATLHQRVVGRLLVLLSEHVRQMNLGEVFVAPYDVLLDEQNIVEPDLIYVANANVSIITEKNIQGAPDLLVEIVSPSTIERDTRDKRNLYARCAVPNYWIIDPRRTSVIELRHVDKAYGAVAELSGDATWTPVIFPQLQIKLQDLWR